MSDERHWDAVYADRAPTELSWYRPRLERSLEWIDACGLEPPAQIVDIGGGASTLVDDLLARGFEGVTVVDLSARALERAQARLGPAAARVRWIVGDLTTPLLAAASVDLWHDRAVFHFLTDERQRRAYVEQLRRALRPRGCVILASFGPSGPQRCSGLPVRRHSSAQLHEALGPGFTLLRSADEVHQTPAGAAQAFAYALCQRAQTS